MGAIRARRVLIVLLLVCVCFNEICGQVYTIPDVTIQALNPQGIRVSIPADPKISLFVFQGNINRKISQEDVGTISAEVTSPTNGRWLYENLTTKLKVGDIINYYVFVVYDRRGYVKDNLSYTVKELVSPSSNSVDVAECFPTSTVVRNGKACAGQIIFEDNFDTLREDLWQLEQYIPGEPDYPFVSYQRPPIAPTVSVQGGYLYIKPILQQDLPGFSNSSIYTGTLDLFSGCTATATKCLAEAWGASILPPIASGRVTSRSFAFTYGVVEVRAKLPQGDWLYPDILLESLMKKYGVLNYASGVLRIAGSCGNPQLSTVNNEVGNKLLYGGPMLDMGCRNTLLSQKLSNKAWGEDFHVYVARWEPERITLSVDGEEWARIEPAASGLQGRFPRTCDLPRSFLSRGSNMAPFDDHFFLTLGLAAGGITEFSDDLTSGGRPKPWRNSSRKASLRFWEDLVSWHRTWIQPGLVVDYVRVRAL
ncbi:beta-1,3-glucan-binding protein-like [Melitaea cinxia]|uniref:beta-1,3-glucan-binding protein-like n=1 Tax=Melitaea cinxia TaxID=113334 RepID=UPI001E26EF9E|nr:beta-1,3-glucan-binding protein-like [Melitaea cinxia]